MEYRWKKKNNKNTTFVGHPDEQNYWFFFFSLTFITIALMMLWVLFEKNGELPTSIAVFDALLIALAVFRLTRLFVYDSITKFLRHLFLVKKTPEENSGKEELHEPEKGPQKTFWHLVNCLWCAGMWFSLLLVFLYYLTPYAWIVIFILAVSGVATLFQIFANFLGSSADIKKKENRAHDQ
jgi:hypothetical protein